MRPVPFGCLLRRYKNARNHSLTTFDMILGEIANKSAIKFYIDQMQ